MIFYEQLQRITSLHFVFNVTCSANVKPNVAFVKRILLEIFESKKIPHKNEHWHRRRSIKIGVPKNFAKLQENTCARVSL